MPAFSWVQASNGVLDHDSKYSEFLGILCTQTVDAREWEQRLLPHELIFLQGHRVGWVPLLPGTCYIEFARAMVTAVFGESLFTLSETKFENILFLDDTDLRGAPFIRVRYEESNRKIAIASRQDGTAWTTNSTMALRLRPSSQTDVLDADVKELRSIPRESDNYVDGERFYAGTGNDYHGEFRALKEAWNLGADGVVSCIECMCGPACLVQQLMTPPMLLTLTCACYL